VTEVSLTDFASSARHTGAGTMFWQHKQAA